MRVRYSSYQGFRLSPILVLIAINFLLFIAVFTVIIVDPKLANKLFSLFGLDPDIFWNQPWTILTSMFLHGGWWHIIANMLTLYFFGSYLSRLVGEAKFLVVYFSGGILGGILYLLLTPPDSPPAIGASGAIFALAGALVMMRPKLGVLVFPLPVPIPLWVAVIGGFLILSLLPFVAWQAHLGGLVFGLIAGYIFRKRERYFLF